MHDPTNFWFWIALALLNTLFLTLGLKDNGWNWISGLSLAAIIVSVLGAIKNI